LAQLFEYVHLNGHTVSGTWIILVLTVGAIFAGLLLLRAVKPIHGEENTEAEYQQLVARFAAEDNPSIEVEV
jgi:hypothetical protein